MKNANDQLRDFTGTTKWYRHFTNLHFTEGVRAMADLFEAYWMIDLVMSYQVEPKIRRQPFQTWTLKRLQDCEFVAIATDGNDNVIAKQRIPFSDFKADELTLWLEEGVLLLPSEH